MRCERNNKGHINTHHYTRPIIHCFSWSLACVFSSQLPAHSSNARTDRPDLAESTWLKGHRIKWTKSSLPEAHHITQLMHFQVNQPFYQKKIMIIKKKKNKKSIRQIFRTSLFLASCTNWRFKLEKTIDEYIIHFSSSKTRGGKASPEVRFLFQLHCPRIESLEFLLPSNNQLWHDA